MGLYQNRIVIKVGTSTLTNEMGKSDLRSFDRLACTLSDIQNMGYEVILVSSGAIAVGTDKLSLPENFCNAGRYQYIVPGIQKERWMDWKT